jgi:threonine/homoserine/homoserine lactone efflux protein
MNATMIASLSLLLTAVTLGFTAGISPGPLLALVVSETLKYGKNEGIKLAFVPFITDMPIVLISVLLLSRINDNSIVLGIISLIGAFFLLYLSYGSIFARDIPQAYEQKPRSLGKGIIANFLSPHPYLFWIFIGSNLLLQAARINLMLAVLFIFLFYVCLVGSKVIIAILTGKFRNILHSKAYLLTIRILGIILLMMAAELFYKSVNYIF